jgi:hypothetical protein
LQPVVVQALLPHGTGVGTGQIVLAPEQNEAGVNIDPLQLAAEHIAVEFWQLPAPSQMLVLPQPLVAAPHRASLVPLASPAQVPRPFTLQAWQAPQLTLPQQTPSTQLPVLHSFPAEQLAPLAFRLQLFGVPVPWQVYGIWQSASAVQEVLQVRVPQTYGKQFIVGGGAQFPAPSQ